MSSAKCQPSFLSPNVLKCAYGLTLGYMFVVDRWVGCSYPYSPGLIHWHCDSHKTATVPGLYFRRVWAKLAGVPLTDMVYLESWHWRVITCRVWDEITYPFPNFNGWTVDVWEWISNSILPTVYNGCSYLPMPGLKLSHVNEGSLVHVANRDKIQQSTTRVCIFRDALRTTVDTGI